jgi:ankyrin repeat protein
MNRIDQELIVASRENNLTEVSRLLRAGADVNDKDHDGWTPLTAVIKKGHVQVVIELVQHGSDISDWMSLYYAWCHLAVVNELLGHGANTEAKTNEGNTPLHLACCNGHLPVVKALVTVGANIRAVNNRGRLSIHYAVNSGHSEVAKYLLRIFYATTRRLPLHDLLKNLTCIGNLDSSDVPPLRYALDRNVLGTDDVVEIVEYLVSRNAALLTSRDQDDSLPLHVACRRGTAFPIVQSLVDLYKASVKSVTPGGDLPLFLACEMPETSLDTIFLLMKLYPDLVYR